MSDDHVVQICLGCDRIAMTGAHCGRCSRAMYFRKAHYKTLIPGVLSQPDPRVTLYRVSCTLCNHHGELREKISIAMTDWWCHAYIHYYDNRFRLGIDNRSREVAA